MVLGIVFIVAGLAFKLGAVPFHMWVPDVYQGAPTAITLLIGGAPKLAAFAIIIRLLVEGMSGLAVDWQQMMMLLAVGSMLLGNVVAIAQSNLKRMLAYSSIAQMGFMLLGLCPGVVYNNTLSAGNSYASSMFYIVAYVLTTLGTFGMIMLLARNGFEAEEINDLKGLAKRSPWFALVMTIFMLSLAGLPPTVGFYAKLSVLQALVSTNLTGLICLTVAAVIFSLVGAYYYLRVIKVMYFDPPADTRPSAAASAEVRAVLRSTGSRCWPSDLAGGPDGDLRAGDRQGAGHRLKARTVATSAAVWLVLLLVAAIAANLPFLNERLFIVGPARRFQAARLARAGIGRALGHDAGDRLRAREAHLGQIQPQGLGVLRGAWLRLPELAFPGFVWRYARGAADEGAAAPAMPTCVRTWCVSEQVYRGHFLDVRRDHGALARRQGSDARIHRPSRCRDGRALARRWTPGGRAPMALPGRRA